MCPKPCNVFGLILMQTNIDMYVYKKCVSQLFSASCTDHVKFVDYH